MYAKRLLFVFIILNTTLQVPAYRVFNTDGGETILALPNETVHIQCKTDMPMSYCGFIHPSGKRYSISGQSLIDGHCTYKIKVTEADSGQWTCHIGRKAIGLEIMQAIQLRVVGQVAAIHTNVTAVHGKPVTLRCATTKKMTPLNYCRFEPPNGGTPFSINSAITNAEPILGRYFFPNNKSIDRGDCVVTIRKVLYDDVGVWTCGAGLEDGKEHIDTITLSVEGLYTMSTASATGITFGVIGIVSFLCVLGVVVWKKRRFLGSSAHEEPDIIEIQELGPRPRTPRVSPQPTRHIPRVVIQSPSEGSSSSPHPIA